MGCISFGRLFFPCGEINPANFHRARLAAAQKLETLVWQYRIMGWLWESLIAEMSNRDILQAISPLDVDGQAYLARYLPRDLVGRVLTALEPHRRAQVREMMHFDCHADNGTALAALAQKATGKQR